MPSSHLILCRPFLLLLPIPPSIRVFSNESTLRMRWPKYWSFSFSIIPSKEIPGLISFRMDWLDLSNEFIYSLMNPKNVCRLWRPHQTYTHNLHFKITELAGRFSPETAFRQDTLLLYNPCKPTPIIYILKYLDSVQFSSVSQSCLTLCDPMNCSTPGLPVHQLPEFTQTHVHRNSDAIQPSHPLSSLSPPAPNPSQHQSLFQWVSSSHEVAKVLEFQLQHQSFQWTSSTDLP